MSNEPSRLLAVMDVSGSMGAVVPGTNGATRIELARAAATRGLGLYPLSSEIGLSTSLARSTATTTIARWCRSVCCPRTTVA